MKRIRSILLVLLSAITVLADSSEQKTKELVQKIDPSLQVIEKQFDEIEADFWKNIRELDTGSQNYLRTNPLYQSFNQKIVDFVSRCGALQRVLYDSGVDIQVQYPLERGAIGILNVWKQLPQLHERIKGRKNPITRTDNVELGADCIESIYLTSKVPKDLLNYEALLDDIVIVNMELFYVTSCRSENSNCHIPPGWNAHRFYQPGRFFLAQKSKKYCKFMSEDRLITSAGEFFMAVRDVRKIIQGLQTNPYPEKKDDFYSNICRIEDYLNQIERKFWDTIYKGEGIAVSNKNLSHYSEFQRLLYSLHQDCRKYQGMLRQKKIDLGEYNPVTDSIVIYDLGRGQDQVLCRQMRRFFNRGNPLEPGSKQKCIEFVYNFRAYDANAKELLFNALKQGNSISAPAPAPASELTPIKKTMPYGVRSYVPYADMVLLNIPERLDEFCTSNIAIFKSDEQEFKALGESAEKYFNAVKGLRRTIEHWKIKFAPPPPPKPISPHVQEEEMEFPGMGLEELLLGGAQPQQPIEGGQPTLQPQEEKIEIPEVSAEELFQLAINKIKQKRIKEAEAYLSHLAENNFVPAQYLVSFISDNEINGWYGEGGRRRRRGDRSFDRPLPGTTWLKKAAEAGYIPAVERWISLNDLQSPTEQEDALLFADRAQAIWRLTSKLSGMSVDKRDQWLGNIRKQATEGNAACQLLLSYCYAADNIIDHSPAKAKEWLQKAVDQGYPEALLWGWGWRPQEKWDTINEDWTGKAVAKGGIPAIAFSSLGSADLPEHALSKLEDAGRRGDELAMCTLLCYYSKREAQYPKQLEQWKRQLKQYRSFQGLIGYPFSRNGGRFGRGLFDAASKELGEDVPFGGDNVRRPFRR